MTTGTSLAVMTGGGSGRAPSSSPVAGVVTLSPAAAPVGQPDWGVLVDLVSAPGFSDESVRVFLATGLSDVGPPEAHRDIARLAGRVHPVAYSHASSVPDHR